MAGNDPTAVIESLQAIDRNGSILLVRRDRKFDYLRAHVNAY